MNVSNAFYGLSKFSEKLSNFAQKTTQDFKYSQSQVKEDVWTPTVCRACFYGQCQVKVRRVDGVVVNMEGMNAPHNAGKICSRCLAAIMDLYDPYRVKVPLKRTNPEKGLNVDPKWVEISWDEAFNLAAEKLKEVKKEDPRQLFISTGDVDDILCFLMVYRLWYGSPMEAWGWSGMAACGSSEHSLSLMTHDAFVTVPDHDLCNYMIICGAGVGFEAFGAGLTPSAWRMADARVSRNTKVVEVDPRCSIGAAKGEWVPIRPGTDLAFTLGLIHTILYEIGRYDVDFVKKHTNGPFLVKPDGYFLKTKEDKPLVWDPVDGKAKLYNDLSIKDYALEGTYSLGGTECKPAFQIIKEAVKEYTPEWASNISTVPAETIRRIAKEFIDNAMIGSTITIEGVSFPYRPALITGYHGAQRHRNGPFFTMCYNILNLLVGNPDVPGGAYGLNPTVLPPPYPDVYKLPPVEGTIGFVPPCEVRMPPNIHLHELYPLTMGTGWIMSYILTHPDLKAKLKVPYTTKVLLNHYTNPFRTIGNPKQTEAAYKEVPFQIHVSVWMDEPTLFADVVLPEHHWLERLSIHTHLPYVGYFGYQLRQPVVKPLYNTKNTWEIFFELTDRMGMLRGPGGWNEAFNKIFLEQMYFAKPSPYRLDINKKHTDEEVFDIMFKALCDPEKGLDWFKKNGFHMWRWPIKELYRCPQIQGARVPIYFIQVKLIGDKVKAAVEREGIQWDPDWSRYTPVPRWEPCHHHHPDKDYDMYCIVYKTAFSTFSATSTNPWLSEISELDPYMMKAWINVETARRKGIKDEDEVWVESKIGKVKLKAKVSECVHPEVVAFGGCFGGYTNHPYGRRGVNYASLIPFQVKNPFDTGPEGTVDSIWCTNDYCTRVKVYKA